MRIQEHIDKISWSLADKALYFIYGVVTLFQMRALNPDEFGIFGLMIGLHTWFFIVIDSFALQNLIQFGMNLENRKKVNFYALIIEIALALVLSSFVYFSRFQFSEVFNEARLVEVGNALPILIFLTIPRMFSIKIIYRNQQYYKLFFTNFVFFGAMTAITVYLLIEYGTLDFSDMLLIYFTGTGLSSLYGLLTIKDDLRFSLRGSVKLKDMVKFSLPWTFYSSFHYLPRNLDIYVVQAFFSTSATGVYYSAKNLFRVFDEALNASFGLVYPAAVRLIERKDYSALNELTTKAVSFLFMAFFTAVVVLEAGVGEWFIEFFLPESYHFAVGQFELLLIAALGMPMLVLSSIITAIGKPYIAFSFSAAGVVLCFVTLYLVGLSGNALFMPLGIIVYIFSNAIMFYIYTNKNFNFKFMSIFRAFGDSKEFIKKLLNKNK